MDLQSLGRILVAVGLALAALGLIFALGLRIPFLGQLPGDIRIERENVRIFIPIGTMLVLSIILTVLLNLIGRR